MKSTNKPIKKETINWIGVVKDLGVVVLVYVAGQISVGLVVRWLAHGRDFAHAPEAVLGAYIVGGFTMVVSLLWLLKKRGIARKSVLFFKKPGLKDVGMVLLGYGMYFMVLTVVLVFIREFVPAINLDQKQDVGLKNIASNLLPMTYIALAILPAISEEMLFRGFLNTRLKLHKISSIVSALMVSVLFGLSHGQLNVGIDTFILSMVMIYVLGTRRNLWVSVGIHMLKNTLAFLGLFVFKIF